MCSQKLVLLRTSSACVQFLARVSQELKQELSVTEEFEDICVDYFTVFTSLRQSLCWSCVLLTHPKLGTNTEQLFLHVIEYFCLQILGHLNPNN